MAIISFPLGLGESLGDVLVTCEPLLFNGDVWYVHHDGDDSYDGRDREKPFATLQQALTDSAAGDMIVCLDGHEETVTASMDISDRYIVGAGRSAGKPTVKFNTTSTGYQLFKATTGTYTLLANIWMAEGLCAPLYVDEISIFEMRDCYVECGDSQAGVAIQLGNATSSRLVRIDNTTIISTATSVSTTPPAGIVSLANAPSMIILNNVTLDNGTYGWTTYKALHLAAVDAQNGTFLHAESLVLENGADIYALETVMGFINAQSGGGGNRIDWVDVGE
jgi:hypothetical protein